MKSSHFRYLVIIGIISILAITSLQFFWFQQAFHVRKVEFEVKVFQALREVAKEIFVFNGNPEQEFFPVEQLSDNYFVVMINDQIDLALLESLLERKFRSENISLPYNYTIYDCASDKLVYGSDLKQDGKTSEKLILPKWDKDQYYFGVYFPEYRQSILGGMTGWFILSFVLLIVVIFFSFALFIVFRQKRHSEIQRDFVNNMTHELKTPLSSIKLCAEALIKRENLNDSEKAYLEIITHESEKLKRQIENVLEQARGEKDGIQLQKDSIEIKGFLKNIIDKFNFSGVGKIDYTLENISEDFTVKIDALHMEHVFHNLLDNVIKYGSEKPQLVIAMCQLRNQLIISWQDDGEGIPKKYKKRIFSPFFRIQKGNVHDQKGFGLGLHYVKNVILAHNGKIRWISKGVKGYFEIILPVK